MRDALGGMRFGARLYPQMRTQNVILSPAFWTQAEGYTMCVKAGAMPLYLMPFPALAFWTQPEGYTMCVKAGAMPLYLMPFPALTEAMPT